MGIDSKSDISADLRIGPTSLGMVRLYVETSEIELPMDFEPDEALEIAEEIRTAALTIHGRRKKAATESQT